MEQFEVLERLEVAARYLQLETLKEKVRELAPHFERLKWENDREYDDQGGTFIVCRGIRLEVKGQKARIDLPEMSDLLYQETKFWLKETDFDGLLHDEALIEAHEEAIRNGDSDEALRILARGLFGLDCDSDGLKHLFYLLGQIIYLASRDALEEAGFEPAAPHYDQKAVAALKAAAGAYAAA